MVTASRLVQNSGAIRTVSPGFERMAALTLTERLFDDADTGDIDPFGIFEEWFAEARDKEPNDPHAMALATVDADGLPDNRMVLLNARDHRGLCFFTNFESAKGTQLLASRKAAVLFHWKSLRRQVRARGPVEVVTGTEADAYFATRPRQSQLGAHASRQSRPLRSRAELVDSVKDLDESLGPDPVNRPAHWSGFRLVPLQMEFWKDGAFRLHDRVQFTRDSPQAAWTRRRLFP
jgi:pyridoxamine 5'-phosphate oxidase